MLGTAKDTQMPPLHTPVRRKRLHTEDNIRVSVASSTTNIKRIRINTLQNQEEVLQRQNSLRKVGKRLNLSPIKYYETKLNLSCEAWAAYSINEGVYKRGWKPNKCVEFNGLIRLVLAKFYFDIVRHHPQASALMVRLNYYLLPEEQKKEKKSVRELQKLTGDKISDYFFADNTLIRLEDLVKGMLVSNNNEILAYATVFMGYLIGKIQEDPLCFATHRSHAVLQSFSEGALATSQLVDHINYQLKKDYSDTYLTTSEFYSTSNELSKFVADIVRNHKRILTILQTREIVSAIRYQVGFKFYEDRTKRIISERVHPSNHVVLSCRGRNNFGVASYNKLTSHVIVLHDCKFSMAEIDISRVEEWLRSVGRPVAGEKSRILPLLKLME